MQAGVDRTGQTSVHFVMPHHCKGGGVGASDGQRGPQSRGCCRQTEAGCYVLRLDWQGIVSQREKKKKKREAIPTESLHAWWLAQDGSEPGSGAGAWGGAVVAGGGGVGLEARRGGFVILRTEGESGHNHYPAKTGAADRQFESKPNVIQSNSDNPHGPAQP